MLESKPVEFDIAKRDLIDGLIKGFDVITAFNGDSHHLTATELAQRVGLSRSAARRYLLTLAHMGLAASDGRSFWLTPKVLNLGRSYLESARLPRAIIPFLQRLTEQLQESSNFSVLDGSDIVYVSRVNAPRLLATGFEPGTRLPAHTTAAGRVLLAALPEAQLRSELERVELTAFTHLTLLDKDILWQEMLVIRAQGYAITESQYEVGLRGISVPIKNRSGSVIGALSVAMNAATCSRAEASERFVPTLQTTANTLMLWI